MDKESLRDPPKVTRTSFEKRIARSLAFVMLIGHGLVLLALWSALHEKISL